MDWEYTGNGQDKDRKRTGSGQGMDRKLFGNKWGTDRDKQRMEGGRMGAGYAQDRCRTDTGLVLDGRWMQKRSFL